MLPILLRQLFLVGRHHFAMPLQRFNQQLGQLFHALTQPRRRLHRAAIQLLGMVRGAGVQPIEHLQRTLVQRLGMPHQILFDRLRQSILNRPRRRHTYFKPLLVRIVDRRLPNLRLPPGQRLDRADNLFRHPAHAIRHSDPPPASVC